MLVDSHCHLYLKSLDQDLDAVLKRAQEKGVERILVPGIDLETSRTAVKISEANAGVYAAVGVHPNESSGWNGETLAALRELVHHPKVVAVGEIGLDHYRDHAPRDVQLNALREQLSLAMEVGLPVVIHNRSAIDILWPELREWQSQLARSGSPLTDRPGVLHSFDGELSSALQAIEHHFFLGISGPVTFKNAIARQELVTALPLEAMLIETDAPYLTPHPYRGRINEPALVALVANKIAELHQIPMSAVAEGTSQNAARLFRWDRID